jgi:hypothetical protein
MSILRDVAYLVPNPAILEQCANPCAAEVKQEKLEMDLNSISFINEPQVRIYP